MDQKAPWGAANCVSMDASANGGFCRKSIRISRPPKLSCRIDRAVALLAYRFEVSSSFLIMFGKDAGPKGSHPERSFEELCSLALKQYLGGVQDGRFECRCLGFPRPVSAEAFSEMPLTSFARSLVKAEALQVEPQSAVKRMRSSPWSHGGLSRTAVGESWLDSDSAPQGTTGARRRSNCGQSEVV